MGEEKGGTGLPRSRESAFPLEVLGLLPPQGASESWWALSSVPAPLEFVFLLRTMSSLTNHPEPHSPRSPCLRPSSLQGSVSSGSVRSGRVATQDPGRFPEGGNVAHERDDAITSDCGKVKAVYTHRLLYVLVQFIQRSHTLTWVHCVSSAWVAGRTKGSGKLLPTVPWERSGAPQAAPEGEEARQVSGFLLDSCVSCSPFEESLAHRRCSIKHL